MSETASQDGRASDAPHPLLSAPLAEQPGVGPKLAQDLASLGLTRVWHLLTHLPMRYERHEAEAPVAELEPDRIVSARGTITATRLAGRGRKARYEAVLMDGDGRLDLVWFNMPFMRDKVRVGDRLRVHGKTKQRGPGLQIANARVERLDAEGEEAPPEDERVRPVYPASERINSARIEKVAQSVLPGAIEVIEDHLPEDFLRERRMPSLAEAYRLAHFPDDEEDAPRGRRRLAYDELLLFQLGVQLKRAHLRTALRAPALKHSAEIDKHIRSRFGFELTPSQDKVLSELVADLTREVPTNRLVQGDVGSGKTVVALYAMLMAVAGGHQAALMAPTEILAEQHAAGIGRMLEGSKVRVGLLTGAKSAADRTAILEDLREGRIDILIGTHALLTDRVRFKSLGVAIIDEQHRFGVHQRAMLRAKEDDEGSTPHMVVMTATPIPRSLALTLFGDLDVSTIDRKPPGRTEIKTRLVTPDQRTKVYRYARERLDKGERAFVVAPAIEQGSTETAAVEPLAKELAQGEWRGVEIGVLHGQLHPRDREATMEKFRTGAIQALVATTVIEVGVDVPEATMMIIESAERFGLAQLHQLRGRVGRGDTPSLCVLIGAPTTDDAVARLQAVASSSDGFKLAEKDFEIRGPGEVFGSRQSGAAPFRVADLVRDLELLTMARRDAADWIRRSAALDAPDEALLRRRVAKAHGEALGLADVG
ncbi:MAG: ATP-dependent DNA helicase RecG [Phycisphaerales bacterium]|nr:ATP-dependent DNA helicase RecG [Phycisphaerales bacterium]